MRIVAVTHVLNEEDIIEAQVRHHAELVDHHIILDNGSSDRTLDILRNLVDEGVSLTILANDSSIFSETQFNTTLYRWAVEKNAADWVFCLDADEFTDTRKVADLRAFLGSVPAQCTSLGVQLVNYDAPTPHTDQEVNVVKRFSRRGPNPIGVWKVFVRHAVAVERVSVDAGNHFISIDGQAQPFLRQDHLLLAHFPNRSPFQWAAKAAVGRLKVLAAGQAELRLGRAGHYDEPFERLKTNPRTWLEGGVAHFENMQTSADLVFDPIDYLGRDLLYTERVDYRWRALAHILVVAEKLAVRLGSTLDGFADVRAQINADLADISVVHDAHSTDHGPSHYGSILSIVWRYASDPQFLTLLGDGWSAPEGSGIIWGIGPSHEFRLYYAVSPAEMVDLEAEVAAALPGVRDRQDIDVMIKGEILTTWTFTRAQNWGLRSVQIPAALIAAAMPLLTIEFRPRSVASPADLEPGNPEERLLGMAIHRIRQLVM